MDFSVSRSRFGRKKKEKAMNTPTRNKQTND